MQETESGTQDDIDDEPSKSPIEPLFAVGRYIKTVTHFYWSHLGAMREYLLDYVPAYEPHRLAQKQIRLYQYKRYENAEYGDEGWKIGMPDWCIVCAKSDCARVRKRFGVERLQWAIRLPIIVGLISIPTAVYFQMYWLAPIICLVGFPLGHHFTKNVEVRMEFYRCDEHRKNRELPKLRVFSDQLVILTGHKSIRKQFLEQAKVHADDIPG